MQQSSDGPSFADDGTREPDANTQAVFEALADPDCRMIVGAATEPMTAGELAEACEIPLSTTYRKIDRLAATPLLEERTRLDMEGNHSAEYVSRVEDVSVCFESIGAAIEVTGPEDEATVSIPRRVSAD